MNFHGARWWLFLPLTFCRIGWARIRTSVTSCRCIRWHRSSSLRSYGGMARYWRLVATRWLAGAILLRFVLGLWLFPWYEAHYRGNYAATAAEIEAVTRGFPLYATDVSATGLSVTAHLDTLRFPDEYLRWPPKQWTNGFVLSYGANAELGQTKATYPLGGNTLYFCVAVRRAARLITAGNKRLLCRIAISALL